MGRHETSISNLGSKMYMGAFLVLIPLFVLAATLVFGLARALLHVWLEYRLKLALLEKYERDPKFFESSQDALDLVSIQKERSARETRQDYTVTGLMIGVIGVGCIALGRALSTGKLAVGIYIGGLGCVGLGVFIALVGFLIRALGQDSISAPTKG